MKVFRALVDFTLYILYVLYFYVGGELDANHPVPFRLTPALQSLISQIGVVGPLQLSVVVAARCLV